MRHASVLALVGPVLVIGTGQVAAQDASRPDLATGGTVRDSTGILETRRVWPANVPLYVFINRLPVSDAKPHVLRICGDWAGAPTIEQSVHPSRVSCILPPPGVAWHDWTYLAGTPDRPGDSVKFKISVSNPEGRDPAGPPIPDGPLVLPVGIKGSVDDIMTGVRIPEIDKAIRAELGPDFYRHGWNSGGEPRLWLGVYTNCDGEYATQYPGICHALTKHKDTTFAVRVEIIHDSQVVAWTRAWWRGTDRSVTPFEGMLSVTVVQERFRDFERNDGTWQLRVKSDPETALRDFRSMQYWQGDVLVPRRVMDASTWQELNAEPGLKSP